MRIRQNIVHTAGRVHYQLFTALRLRHVGVSEQLDFIVSEQAESRLL